jgi:hypothetical protein
MRIGECPPRAESLYTRDQQILHWAKWVHMKTANLVIGIILIVLALGAWGASAVIVSGNCATTQAASTLYGIPLCSTDVTEAAVSGLFGLIFLVIGIVLLVKGRSTHATSQMNYQAPIQICTRCGFQRMTTGAFCPNCGNVYPTFIPPPSPTLYAPPPPASYSPPQ